MGMLYKQNQYTVEAEVVPVLNPLMPELNPSMRRCLMRFFTGDFPS
jgi:hypothetical protein